MIKEVTIIVTLEDGTKKEVVAKDAMKIWYLTLLEKDGILNLKEI